MSQQVIIAGFGPIGRVLADALQKQKVPFAIIDANPVTVRNQRALGRTIIGGDATTAQAWENAGIDRADIAVITVRDPQEGLRICGLLRSIAPNVTLVIRTRHLSEALQAKQCGADYIVVEEIEAANQMASLVPQLLRGGHALGNSAAGESHDSEP